MVFIETLVLCVLALGLAMDAFAVSVSNGISYNKMRRKRVIYMAFLFGIFQALMPVTGYYLGNFFYNQISIFDHWIAFLLLAFIGGKMLIEAIKDKDKDDKDCKTKELNSKMLITQAIATSIDALAVGVSFSALDVNIFQAVMYIGIITFICSYLGVSLGRAFGILLKKKAEIFGGCILIFIGLKIFIEHIFNT